MTKFILSICIPTFNRAQYIEQTLKSIIPKINKNIEIVIYDGASSDNTDEIIYQYTIKYKNIIYYKALKNGGVDRDYANCIEMARGKYCWLMSSDDIVPPNSIEKILDSLKCNSDIYLFNRAECNKKMIPFNYQYWLKSNLENKLFNIRSRDDLLLYFKSVKMFGGIFSYAPSIIVKRERWLSVQGASKYYGTCYAHVYRLLRIMLSGCNLQYIKDCLILCRMDNDSFTSNGLVKRYVIDFEGYIKISKALFQNDKILSNAFLKILKREHNIFRLIKFRSNIKTNSDWDKFKIFLHELNYSMITINLAGFIGSFDRPIKIILFLRKKIKSVYGR
jgi:abequosyltransferase